MQEITDHISFSLGWLPRFNQSAPLPALIVPMFRCRASRRRWVTKFLKGNCRFLAASLHVTYQTLNAPSYMKITSASGSRLILDCVRKLAKRSRFRSTGVLNVVSALMARGIPSKVGEENLPIWTLSERAFTKRAPTKRGTYLYQKST